MLQGMNILYENNSLVHYYFPIVAFKQWGVDNRHINRRTITLPISFNNFSIIVASGINTDESANCGYHMNTKALNSFSYLYGVSVCYIALGI